MDSKKSIYFFSKENPEGRSGMKNLLGGKGANLAEMASLGVPVPPGFTITTDVCCEYLEKGGMSDELWEGIKKSVGQIGEWSGKSFGDPACPLLVSVRSGARVSMPGMMDTILNLGLNEKTLEGLVELTGQERFVWDSYRRFVQMYSNVVMGMNGSVLEALLEDHKTAKSYKSDADLTADDFKELVIVFKKQILEFRGQSFPEDPWDQLKGAVEAVFDSWNNSRAKTYRQLNGIADSWGTAVNVQAMVFGNMGSDCGTGVAFTRDPSTGEKLFFGEYLIDAQGEDVVAGIRTPSPLCGIDKGSLEKTMPIVYGELCDIYKKLELHYRDMQDLEFTIEKGRLWMLQTRTGKRTAQAALKIAWDMYQEGLITKEEAILRVDPESLDQLLHPTLDRTQLTEELGKALPASPGGVSGQVVLTSEKASSEVQKGHKVILVRQETSPEDIEGMVAAEGILTARGGMTSHAAVVARGMGKCCVSGLDSLFIDREKGEIQLGGRTIKEGEFITLDGSTGQVFLGQVPTKDPDLGEVFHSFMSLADEVRTLKVRTNADTPEDAQKAKEFGAEGIGLCRTEHMFFGVDRIDSVRAMILAENSSERKQALSELLPHQIDDFYKIFKVMDANPVTIRLLDPPLHEFLPHTETEVIELAKRLNLELSQIKQRMLGLSEFNPMLGHRGCRLAVTAPEIYEMQVTAIARAALKAKAENVDVRVEIMVPLVGTPEELKHIRNSVEFVMANELKGDDLPWTCGTMIELPRAALTADEIAVHADFFSFGTNDLTQTTLGLSRDDSSRFLGAYLQHGLYNQDPFVSVDQKGVGKLVQMGVQLGRATRADLKVGICGEHGGDPKSIEFFQSCGLDYVSCSPYRVPIARLSAAQAQIKEQIKQNERSLH